MDVSEARRTEPVTRPEFAQWATLLSADQSIAGWPEHLRTLRKSARSRLIDAAHDYGLRLYQAAADAGVTLPSTPVRTGDPDAQRLVMTGHQPVIFHGGLTYKYACTERLAAEQSAIGLAVSIDTDMGDPGLFQSPLSALDDDSSGLQLAESSFCQSASMYCAAEWLPTERLAALFEQIDQQLAASSANAAAVPFRSVAAVYSRLAAAGVRPVEANSIARWTRGIGHGLLELPLSAICAFPEVIQVTANVVSQGPAFVEEYNRQLDQFRADHKIRNAANPFPNMQANAGGCELPFWAIDAESGKRRPTRVQIVGDQVTLQADGQQLIQASSPAALFSEMDALLEQGIQLVPRGALVSAFLRLLFADLFVHGLGGEHYDPCTDRIIKAWWHASPTPFVAASASEYLFAAERDELLRLRSLEGQLRDLRYNPQRHLGSGVFTAEHEQQLGQLITAKQAAVDSMKTAHADGKSAKDIGHEIQQISDQIRASVDDAFQTDLDALEQLTPEVEAAWDCRTYPWFLFGGAT